MIAGVRRFKRLLHPHLHTYRLIYTQSSVGQLVPILKPFLYLRNQPLGDLQDLLYVLVVLLLVRGDPVVLVITVLLLYKVLDPCVCRYVLLAQYVQVVDIIPLRVNHLYVFLESFQS